VCRAISLKLKPLAQEREILNVASETRLALTDQNVELARPHGLDQLGHTVTTEAARSGYRLINEN
jgi:hypothetical protein